MHEFKLYYEAADTDDPRRFLGIVWADTQSQTPHLGSAHYEYAVHDLAAVQVIPE